MKRGRQGDGGGRPRFVIDYEAVGKLAMLQCTHEEIAAFLGCSSDTLAKDDKFLGVYKAGIEKGRMSLRRHQWRALEAGNTTMLVWLGKQYLHQRDRFDVDATHRNDPTACSDEELLAIIASRRSGRTSEEKDAKAGLH